MDISYIYGLFPIGQCMGYPQTVDVPCGFVDNLRRTAGGLPVRRRIWTPPFRRRNIRTNFPVFLIKFASLVFAPLRGCFLSSYPQLWITSSANVDTLSSNSPKSRFSRTKVIHKLWITFAHLWITCPYPVHIRFFHNLFKYSILSL